LSKKILREAQAQQAEVEAEAVGEAAALVGAAIDVSGRSVVAAAKKKMDSDDDSDFDDDYSDSGSQWDMEEVEVTEEDEKALAAFMVRA
jgi:hypothetical protein